MNVTAILTVIEKGINIISTLYAGGVDVTNAIEALQKIAAAAKNGTVTQADMEFTERLLDSMIDDFNLD